MNNDAIKCEINKVNVEISRMLYSLEISPSEKLRELKALEIFKRRLEKILEE